MFLINKYGFTNLSYKAVYSFQTLKLFVLFRIVDPIMQYVFFAALASSLVGSDYLQYVVIGQIAFYVCRTMMINFLNMFRMERRYGTLELNIASPTPTLLIIIRKGIVPLLDGLFVFIVGLLIGRFLFGLQAPLADLGLLILSIAVTLFSIICFSLLFASIGLLFSNVNLFLNISIAFFQVFCGVNFSVTVLPEPLENLARLMPLTHSIEALRSIYNLENNEIMPLLGTEFIIGIGYLIISITLVSIMEMLARRTGALFKDV
ncbi:ABC transporter permease [Bacillus sp. FJAT-27245]|uniref:ABC transporter permease n=1 Tax=Bacillus sp. FJAT-27245 TaxID=1684144 RepID=UPI0006A78F0D|nr:ABC transporter permease [Bacillus sp. FJAT-27245]